jgi:hypothetical protein
MRSLPWEIDAAREVLAEASRQQHDHQDAIRDAVKAAARADQLYRVALAAEIARQREAGAAATLAKDLARGDERIAMFAYEAAITEGNKEIAIQEGWRLHANRKDSQELADWSKRKDLATDYGQIPAPAMYEDVTPPRVE